jgi:flagellar hook-basal body complex protein FliE
MTIASISQALSAYGAAQRRARLDGAASDAASVAAPRFENLLRAELQGTGENLRTSEAKAVEALTGKASLQQVVEAVTEAELSLQKMTAVRDRVISAYQEIMRMPI